MRWPLFSAGLIMLISCGSENGASNVAAASAITSDAVYIKGHDLVEKYQCSVCHKVDEKLTGPAHADVAKKYAGADTATIDKLAQKIIDGGSGVWGEVPMTPHPNVSLEDAKIMVEYILLLNKR